MNGHGVFTSPTESEFSESYRDGKESVVDWDEARVAEWLKSISCGQYVEIFRNNNINGETTPMLFDGSMYLWETMAVGLGASGGVMVYLGELE